MQQPSDDILNHLIEAINSSNPDEASYWIRMIKKEKSYNLNMIPLNILFSAFSLNDPDLSILVSNLIFDLVRQEDFPTLSQKYTVQLLSGLEIRPSGQEPVNNLCLNIIFQLGYFKDHFVHEDFIKPTLNLIYSPHFKTSSLLIEYLTKLKPEVVIVFVNPLLELFTSNSSLSHDPVVQFRFLELFLALGSLHDATSVASNKTIFSHQLLDSFIINIKKVITNVNDPLLCVNGLQTVLDCIQSEVEFKILNDNGILDLLISMLLPIITSASSAPTTIICKIFEIISECSLKKFLCKEFVISHGLDGKVLDYIQCEIGEDVLTSSAIVCAASIATIGFLDRFDTEITEKLFHGSSYVQVAALHALGIIFSSPSIDSEDKLNLLVKLNKYNTSTPIFDWLSERIMSRFDEAQNATYFALKGILSFGGGIKFALDNSSIISNIIRRDLDESILGLKWKYGIIESITENEGSFSLLNEALQGQFRKYLSQGVVFVPTMTRVAFETSD